MPHGRRLGLLAPAGALRRPLGQGALLGVAFGLVLAVVVLSRGAGLSSAHAPAAGESPRAPLLDAAHLPPLLTVPGETVELRYDIYCPPPAGAATDACDAAGTAYVRAGSAGRYTALPLTLDRGAAEGRYVARVPRAVAAGSRGFTYYAVLRDRSTGASMTLPAGGAAAPARSWPIRQAVNVDLDEHAFGRARSAGERVFSAIWGQGDAKVGLQGGPESQPVGPSSFAVTVGGTVHVLDQANSRVLRIERGERRPSALPVAVNGTIADLAVGEGGSLWVLETAGADGPRLREFAPDGTTRGSIPLADRTASQIRIDAGDPVVKQYPSEQWLPAVQPSTGRPLTLDAQRDGGEPAQPARGEDGVVVLAARDELRIALTGTAGVRTAWRLRSRTPLGEVQLAEPFGAGVLVVVRVYDEQRDEFVVAQLGPAGLGKQFSLDSADWAETAPLSRFRLLGHSLYQLGSTPAGTHVDRFDLEVTS